MYLPAIAFWLLRTLAASGSDAPTLQADRNEVMLDVVVRDKHGRLVRDLRPEELHVADDGTAVKPASFRLVELGASPGRISPPGAICNPGWSRSCSSSADRKDAPWHATGHSRW
jgi:hypothetical protein